MKILTVIYLFGAVLLGTLVHGQTVGLLSHKSGSLDSGYVIFSPGNDTTYMIDKCGKLAHAWPGQDAGPSFVYLQSNGTILRTGHYQPVVGQPGNGKTQLIDWDGKLLWSYAISDSTHQQHHDVCLLPNGNILCLVLEIHQNAEALAMGRDSFPLGPWFACEEVVELKPIGTDSAQVLWTWRVWDHLIQDRNGALPSYGVVAQHPELINLNYMPRNASLTDWLHINSIKFNPELNLILLSVHNFGEVWIIDHSTTTQTASSHSGGYHGRGGDLLYRWGNSSAYNRGTASTQEFFGQHDANWIPKGCPDAGKIIVFNNGLNRFDSAYSSVDIFTPALDSPGVHNTGTRPLGPDSLDKRYTDPWPTHFFSINQGSAQELTNGNILICDGKSGEVFEVDSTGKRVWDYMIPVNDAGRITQDSLPTRMNQFQATFYPASHPAFKGRDLMAVTPIENHPLDYDCALDWISPVRESRPSDITNELFVYPNPATDHVTISQALLGEHAVLYNVIGQNVGEWKNANELNTARFPNGLYTLIVYRKGEVYSTMISVLK